jgi:hypothetical protein
MENPLIPLLAEEHSALADPAEITPHPLEVPPAALRQTFYPMGFPVEVRTNAPQIFEQFAQSCRYFDKLFDVPPIVLEVHVVNSNSTGCPPPPNHRILPSSVVWFADADHYAFVDLAAGSARIVVSTAALRHPLYLRYFFLEAAALNLINSRHTTPVHAGCVALHGRGVLLCGVSGAGKSTLSYACARAGWAYVTDDAALLLNNRTDRVVIGNCHQVRFRPAAADLFPEIVGLPITPRAEGKPSIEVPTATLPIRRTARAAQVDAIVFLNRSAGGPPQLMPGSQEAARQSMRQVLFGPANLVGAQRFAIERLLTAEVFEFQYSALAPAIDRLERLMREGV